jgi:hypothetical protein
MMANCNSCQAPVIWVKTSTRKRVPIDVDPVPNGNILKRQSRRLQEAGVSPDAGQETVCESFCDVSERDGAQESC